MTSITLLTIKASCQKRQDLLNIKEQQGNYQNTNENQKTHKDFNAFYFELFIFGITPGSFPKFHNGSLTLKIHFQSVKHIFPIYLNVDNCD